MAPPLSRLNTLKLPVRRIRGVICDSKEGRHALLGGVLGGAECLCHLAGGLALKIAQEQGVAISVA